MSTQTPALRLSKIVPVHNGDGHIEQPLEDPKAQAWSRLWEVIRLTNGLTGSSRPIVGSRVGRIPVEARIADADDLPCAIWVASVCAGTESHLFWR